MTHRPKIIQFQIQEGSDYAHPGIFVLCEDGSMWFRRLGTEEWTQEPPGPNHQQ